MFLAAVYDPNVHSFYDEPLAYTDRYHKYPDFKDHKTSYRDGELKKRRFLFFASVEVHSLMIGEIHFPMPSYVFEIKFVSQHFLSLFVCKNDAKLSINVHEKIFVKLLQ